MKQSNFVTETAYLLRKNGANLGTKSKVYVDIDLSNKDTIIQVSGVKKTSFAKKNIVLKLEAQINHYSNVIGDCSINAKLKKEVYESSRKNARKKLKAKV